jgi:hypothetical protein
METEETYVNNKSSQIYSHLSTLTTTVLRYSGYYQTAEENFWFWLVVVYQKKKDRRESYLAKWNKPRSGDHTSP